MSEPHQTPYPHLLAPLQIGRHTLRNRSSWLDAYATRADLRCLERRVAFYAERARGGVGLIVTAGYSPNAEGRFGENEQLLDRTEQLIEHQPSRRLCMSTAPKYCCRYYMPDGTPSMTCWSLRLRSPPPINKRTRDAWMKMTSSGPLTISHGPQNWPRGRL